METAARAEPVAEKLPVVRRMDFPFAGDIPRHWMFGSAPFTHMANGLHILFPHGERMFIRSVKQYQDVIDRDPVLRARVRAFAGQEGHHAREHERFMKIMEQHGYDLDPLLRFYVKTIGVLWDAMRPELRLAVTCALEHYTATFAARGLTEGFLEHIHPVMRDLLKWHACEEIEHRSVAFDVMQRVAPEYRYRVQGMTVASLGLFAFWTVAAVYLARQDRHLPRTPGPKPATRRVVRREMIRRHPLLNGVAARAIAQYLRPSFHPDELRIDHLAQDYFASIGRAAA
jgi:predicted metal-dependent hydrolase